MDVQNQTVSLKETLSRDTCQDFISKLISKKGCSLNTTNNYRENIVHICAANKCNKVIEMILRQHGTEKADTKNKFGWTPLMQALRERHMDTVQLLINSGFHPFHRSYLGVSTLGIAAAASYEAFEYIFARYPAAISSTANDDVSPLCIAAMKNDKSLFLRILKLGVPIHTASEYTHFMMRQSVHEEIRKLAKPRLSVEDFWNNHDDDIEVYTEPMNTKEAELNDDMSQNSIFFNDNTSDLEGDGYQCKPLKVKKNLQCLNVDVGNVYPNIHCLSPNLVYNQTGTYCMSPNACYNLNPVKTLKRKMNNTNSTQNPSNDFKPKRPVLQNQTFVPIQNETLGISAKNIRKIRPPNLYLNGIHKGVSFEVEEDLNKTLGFTPDFKAIKSPNAPQDSDDEDAFGEKTPTPPRCSTPPTGIVLSCSQSELVRLLHAHKLDRHVPLFLQQEVDIFLFSTLQDVDLIDIGIKNENDRIELLEVIREIRNE